MNRAIAFSLTVLILGSMSGQVHAAVKSTAADRTGVSLTVYNTDLVQVNETRKTRIGPGSGEVLFTDIANQILPATVKVNAGSDLKIVEQHYAYDLANPDALMQQYVGKEIKIVQWNEYHDRKETVKAILRSYDGRPVYEINNEIYLDYPGYKILPDARHLVTTPTLFWLYESKKQMAAPLEVSYLTRGMQWNADYALELDGNKNLGSLNGWITVYNQTGADFSQARLRLVAGELNREQELPIPARQEMMMMKAQTRDALVYDQAIGSAQNLNEYHTYDVLKPVTLLDGQSKQIPWVQGEGINVQPEYVVESPTLYWGNRTVSTEKLPVQVRWIIKNSSENNLGVPLASGIVRLYQKDDQGVAQFIGEDRIEHTAVDEELRLQSGTAFDVTAERRQTDYQQLTQQLYEAQWEVVVRNKKKTAITVGVREQINGQWEIVSASQAYEKENAGTIRFDMNVPAGKEVKISYRVRFGI